MKIVLRRCHFWFVFGALTVPLPPHYRSPWKRCTWEQKKWSLDYMQASILQALVESWRGALVEYTLGQQIFIFPHWLLVWKVCGRSVCVPTFVAFIQCNLIQCFSSGIFGVIKHLKLNSPWWNLSDWRHGRQCGFRYILYIPVRLIFAAVRSSLGRSSWVRLDIDLYLTFKQFPRPV